ncbi:CGNR zinc finger domain-containing protein [Actinoplanes sp. GCM10030250]|uniref:CGNR zinc finger domain-containing protein n=1 Tax=Actinoplanes sp. GCM10030250 TaxID=3273376 RepID=UPI0036182C0E
MGFPALYGGLTCLDFANTVEARELAHREEHLFGYPDLVRWAAYADVLDRAGTRHLVTLAKARPQAAEASFTAAMRLRGAIYRVCAGDVPPAAADLAFIQRGYAGAMAAATLAPGKPGLAPGGYGLSPGRSALAPGASGHSWALATDHLDRAWWPAATSAIALLTGGPLDRVKRCAARERCTGLFLDTSKNRSRRWCSMDTCGTDAKVTRQTARRHSRG